MEKSFGGQAVGIGLEPSAFADRRALPESEAGQRSRGEILGRKRVGRDSNDNAPREMKVEVRAVGLKAMREKRGPTQRKLAHDLGISQNYIPAIEAGSRHAGPETPGTVGEVLRLSVP